MGNDRDIVIGNIKGITVDLTFVFEIHISTSISTVTPDNIISKGIDDIRVSAANINTAAVIVPGDNIAGYGVIYYVSRGQFFRRIRI